MGRGECRLGRMTTPAPGTTRRRGFTLVEALVAMAIFAIGLAALMPLVIANVRANSGAAIRTRGVALAQEKAEEIRALPYDTALAMTPGTETVEAIYTRAWSFPAVPPLAGDGNDLRRVAVTVNWNAGPRGSGSVTFVTTKARY
ncbi:MAG: prepilin-type N-terminal cleavage/methylation domain-containing protein [Proteobacteria bacterium]|nr:prepilin-type N-terminal cleavage/methylation domain-containing protein [Pseudomonadota bacterium]